MDIDYAAWRFWIGIGQWGFNILVAIYLWINRRHQATNVRVTEIDKRVTAGEKDIIEIRSDLKHLPDQKQFDRLSADIRLLTCELGEMKGRLGGLNRVADLMNEFLINQGGGKNG